MYVSKTSYLGWMEATNNGLLIPSNAHSEKINPMLAEVTKQEIPLEDLQIGERIGIGKNLFILVEEKKSFGNMKHFLYYLFNIGSLYFVFHFTFDDVTRNL